METNIKEIYGIKILKRHSASSIITGLLCLCIVAISVLLLFTPWLSFSYLIGEETDPTKFDYTGLELIKILFDKAKMASHPLYELTNTYFSGGQFGFLPMVIKYCFIGLPIALFIILFISLFYVIWSLQFIFVGYKRRNKSPYSLTYLYLFLLILYFGVGIAINVILGLAYKTLETPSFSYKIDLLYGYIYLGSTFLILIILGIIYACSFKNRIYIGDINFQAFGRNVNNSPYNYPFPNNNNNGNEHIVYKTKYIEKDQSKIVEPKGLPGTISSISGHAFSNNMSLEIANIPEGIKSLGVAAFSNCGNLKMVSIPKSCKKIHANCFFNCTNLKRINYAGTSVEWRHIKRESNWLLKAGTSVVVCTDKPVLVNTTH